MSRLTVDGHRLLQPDGTPIVLRGFNLLYQLGGVNALPHNATDDLAAELVPGTNLVRAVVLRWHDRPTEAWGHPANDCAHVADDCAAVQPRCVQQVAAVIKWASRRGLWTVVTARGSLAAGESFAGHDLGLTLEGTVFTNASMRARFISMWTAVATRVRIDLLHVLQSPPFQATNESRIR